MAHGRRREERQRVVDQAQWVGAMFGDLASAYAIDQYLRFGQMPDGSDKKMPHMPEVDAIEAEIRANGGKLVVRGSDGR